MNLIFKDDWFTTVQWLQSHTQAWNNNPHQSTKRIEIADEYFNLLASNSRHLHQNETGFTELGDEFMAVTGLYTRIFLEPALCHNLLCYNRATSELIWINYDTSLAESTEKDPGTTGQRPVQKTDCFNRKARLYLEGPKLYREFKTYTTHANTEIHPR